MRCEIVCLNLKAYADHELNPLLGWQIRRHIAHCPSCKAEWATLQTLHQRLREADYAEQKATPAPKPTPSKRQKRSPRRAPTPALGRQGGCKTPLQPAMSLRSQRLSSNSWLWGARILGGILTAIVFAGYLHQHAARPLGRQVREALDKVNTWHLKGWRLVDGKQVPWEAWGQRKPFLYREVVGDKFILDTQGLRWTSYLPNTTNPAYNQPGLITKVASKSGTILWNTPFTLNIWGEERQPAHQAKDTADYQFITTYKGTEKYISDIRSYLIDRHTHLPMQLEHQSVQKQERLSSQINLGQNTTIQPLRKQNSEPIPTEFAKFDYNQPLPANIQEVHPPKGYLTVDATVPVRTSSTPPDSNTPNNVLTVQIEPFATDSQGRVLAQTHYWLGKEPLPATTALDIDLVFDVKTPLNKNNNMEYPLASVETGPPYLTTLTNEGYLVFLPTEPTPPGTPHPQKLHLDLVANVVRSQQFPHFHTLAFGFKSNVILLGGGAVTAEIPIPQPSSTRNLASYLPPQIESGRSQDTLESTLDEYLSRYYHTLCGIENAGAVHLVHFERPPLQKSAVWLERSIAASRTETIQQRRLLLAQIYHDLQDFQRAKQTLLDVLADTRWKYVNTDTIPTRDSKTHKIIGYTHRINKGYLGHREAKEHLKTWKL